MVLFGTCVYASLWFWYRRENGWRGDGRGEEGLEEDEMKEMGDDSPRYVYTI